MKLEEDVENNPPTNLAPSEGDTQEHKRRTHKLSNSPMRILVRADPVKALVSAPSKPTNSDQDTNLPRDHQTITDVAKIVTTKRQEEGTHGGYSAFYVPIKCGHETRGNIKRLQNNQLT